MKKIEWKSQGSRDYMKAEVGSITLRSNIFYQKSKKRWLGSAHLEGIGRETTYHISPRYGSLRKSIDKAKEDAVRLAKEMLTDCSVALAVEMENFGLQEME
jgi:hypothetical protein